MNNNSASGLVYKGMDVRTGKAVAIKILYGSAISNVKVLKNEIILLATTPHENVVQYLGSYLYDNEISIVMQYMDGGSLTELLSKNLLTEPQISAVCREVFFLFII